MFNKRVSVVLLLVLLVALAISVTSAFAADNVNRLEVAPQCEVVENAWSEYLVICVDNDIVDVQIREVGLEVVSKWSPTQAYIEVTGESNSPSLRGPGDGLNINGILIWKVIDSEGHSKQGVYRR